LFKVVGYLFPFVNYENVQEGEKSVLGAFYTDGKGKQQLI